MLSKEMREKFTKAIEGASPEVLNELKTVLIQRVETTQSLGAPDDGSEEKLKIIEDVSKRISFTEFADKFNKANAEGRDLRCRGLLAEQLARGVSA